LRPGEEANIQPENSGASGPSVVVFGFSLAGPMSASGLSCAAPSERISRKASDSGVSSGGAW
jgi:hypothetical protein